MTDDVVDSICKSISQAMQMNPDEIDIVRDILREALTLTEPAADAIEALRLILPLAKGYASANRVGSNAEYVAHAEAVLEALTPKPLVKFGENLGAVLTHEKLEELAALEPSPFPLDDGWRDLQMDPPPRDGRQKIFICRNGSIFVADHIEAREISVSERRKIYEATGEWPSADWTPTHWRRPPSPPGQR